MLAALKSQVADFIHSELIKELESQDHVATGKLRDSIRVEVHRQINLTEIRGYSLFYGSIQDQGQRPGIKVPIGRLIDWIRAKRIDLRGKSELQVAFAIRTAIYKKGTPTDGDPRKKRWISGTLEKNEAEIVSRITSIVNEYILIQFENMIEDTQRDFDRTAYAA